MRYLRLLAYALIACNSYDPDLGHAPFQCGFDPPRCPEGYTAVDVSTILCHCLANGLVPDAPPPYSCVIDTHEPNESYKTAAMTQIGLDGTVFDRVEAVALCPLGDIDYYALVAPKPKTIIAVELAFDQVQRPPEIDILNGEGASLHPRLETPQPGRLLVTTEAATTGLHYVQMSGNDPVNYALQLTITLPQ